MAFQPVPTYADPVLVDEKTGKSGFNPVWLSWFLTLSNGGLSGTITHNQLAGLQGGLPSERFHLTQHEYNNVVIRNLGAPVPIALGASPAGYQNVNVYDVDIIVQGTSTTQIQFTRDGVNFYDVGLTQGMFHASPADSYLITYTVIAPNVTEIPR